MRRPPGEHPFRLPSTESIGAASESNLNAVIKPPRGKRTDTVSRRLDLWCNQSLGLFV